MKILDTERLTLRLLEAGDAPFILELVNEPGWLRFIGDRGIRTVEAARDYIVHNVLAMQEKYGFSLYLAESKTNNERLGMCGLIKRDTLNDVDIGFAFLARHAGRGYAHESAAAVMRHARETLRLSRIVAITSPENERSIRLLEKIGLRFDKFLSMKGKPNDTSLYTSDAGDGDRAQIDALTAAFFSAFSPNAEGRVELDAIRRLFVPHAVIVRTCGAEPQVYDLDRFIAPRATLLNDGAITEFREAEVAERTEICGQVAQRFCLYEKSWKAEGQDFAGRGVKTIQFVKTRGGWRISALAWDDERDGFAIDPALSERLTKRER